MAALPTLADPRLSRGRGRGIRLTSYSPSFDFPSAPLLQMANSISVYKSFFEKRKKFNGTRQKLKQNFLRTLQYNYSVNSPFSSHSKVLSCKSPASASTTMPSPASTAPPITPVDTSDTWTSVENGPKLTKLTTASTPVRTTNSFEALTDDDHDDSPDSTEFGTSEIDTDMDANEKTKRKTKSNRKTKKSSKKSRKARRKKRYVKFIDSDSDDDEYQPSPTQEDHSSSTNNKETTSTTSDQPAVLDDLVDSDKETTPLKPADIRNFMTPQKETHVPSDSPTQESTPPNLSDSKSPSIPSNVCRTIIDRTSVLNPSTEPTVINAFTRYEMISMLYQWDSKSNKPDSFMLNESMESLKKHIYALQSNMDDVSHEIRITAAHQEKTQSRELKYRLSTQTTPHPLNEADTSTNKTLHYDNSNTGGLTTVPEATDAETLGMNINMMMARPISNNPLRPPPVNTSSISTKVPLTQFTARFDISTKNTTVINVPLIARQLFRIFKKADRTLRLLPWFPDPQNDIAAIDQEDEIPTQETQIKQWVDNPRMVNSRLIFAMRVESMVQFKHIRDTFIPWMHKNDSYIKLDTLSAREIYGLGFIADIHPRFYNRALLKDFLHQQLQKKIMILN